MITNEKRFESDIESALLSSAGGYIKGEDGTFAIDEDTAPVVRQIYALCLAGNGPGKIARMLTEQNTFSVMIRERGAIKTKMACT